MLSATFERNASKSNAMTLAGELLHRVALRPGFREPAHCRQFTDRQRMQRGQRRADARLQAPHALRPVSAQIDGRILSGQQRRQVRLGAQIQVDCARAFVSGQNRRGQPPRAAGGLDDDAARLVIAAAPEPQEHGKREIELRAAHERVELAQYVMGVGQRPQRQRFAQRQHVSRLVEQPAHECRADVTRMKDEMEGTRRSPHGARPRRRDRWEARRPAWPGSGCDRRGNSRRDRRPRRTERARPSRERGRASADRRRATPASRARRSSAIESGRSVAKRDPPIRLLLRRVVMRERRFPWQSTVRTGRGERTQARHYRQRNTIPLGVVE